MGGMHHQGEPVLEGHNNVNFQVVVIADNLQETGGMCQHSIVYVHPGLYMSIQGCDAVMAAYDPSVCMEVLGMMIGTAS